jgi:hypothetical protein
MDHAALKERVSGRADIVIGDVAETVKSWTGPTDAPLGAVMFDLDFYTSTRDALPILKTPAALPRVWCYMDDISGYPENAYSDSIGVRLAIREFNQHLDRQNANDHISPAFVFRGLSSEPWHEQIYIYHRLSHPDYNRCLSSKKHQLPLAYR